MSEGPESGGFRGGLLIVAGAGVDLYRQIRDEELAKLGGVGKGRLRDAANFLDELVLSPDMQPFLTSLAYERLD